jgi:hypothetical protein
VRLRRQLEKVLLPRRRGAFIQLALQRKLSAILRRSYVGRESIIEDTIAAAERKKNHRRRIGRNSNMHINMKDRWKAEEKYRRTKKIEICGWQLS